MDALTAGVPVGNTLSDFAALPPEAPLAMPVQSLRRRPDRPSVPTSAPRGIALRRFLVFGAAIALTAEGAREMDLVLAVGGLTPLATLVLALFVVLFAWVALSFTSAVGGFLILLRGGDGRLGIDPARPLPVLDPGQGRCALLMPTYNEQPARVAAGLAAIHASLAERGAAEAFDIFILSDTTDPDVWIAEEAAFLDLRQQIGDRIHYRHRPLNTARKAGNIADWVRRWGAAYPQMIILDADSVMTGDSIIRLVAAMQSHPDVGLIQTLPIIVNGRSLFARMQQFAGRVYGPLVAHGIAAWHGAEGNYWGHNAVIRTRAFAEQAGLPDLPGRKPFGGHVMSHDFVEAALMRRAGWAIHMVPALHGSYEESPPSLTDLSIRDRRWCQGNLQHAAILPARGLHWISRVHMAMGIGSYITAPLWLFFLVVGVAISLQARFVTPDYFPAGRALFPAWPIVDPVRSMWVFIATMGLLLAPKLLSWLALLCNPAERRGCGGAIRSGLSLLLETLLAGLVAPITMLVQSRDVISILAGRDSGWQTQRRDDGSIPFRETVRRYAGHTIFGLVLGLIAWLVSPALAAWMSPVIAGLVLAIPLVMLTASVAPGQALRRLGLLRIPEESAPPAVLVESTRRQSEAGTGSAVPIDAIARLRADAPLRAAHIAMLPPPRRPRLDPIDPILLTARLKLDESPNLADLTPQLTRAEKLRLLGDPEALSRLMALGD